MKNILIFPSATEVAIEYWNSLKNKKDLTLFGASSCANDHSGFLYKNPIILPHISDEKFLSRLNRLIKNLHIDLVIPTHVEVIDYFSVNSSQILCKQLIQTLDSTRNTRSKRKTYSMLKTRPYCPRVFEHVADYENDEVYFVKKDSGTGGVGSKKIQSKEEFLHSTSSEELVVCEYLPGNELTVDCFSDEDFGLRYCFPRFRSKVRMGTSFRSEELVCQKEKELIEAYVAEISHIFGLRGAWFAQFKKTQSGEWKLLEVDPRLSGSASINRINGVNLAYLNVLTALDLGPIEISAQKITRALNRRTYTKFQINLVFDAVYIDLDSTIVYRGSLQIDIIKFLFQCVNRGCFIALLTKSLSSDLTLLLKQLRIYQIFDEIIHINEDDTKSKYIDVSKNPIFIDDSFSQRRDVSTALGIPAFDPDAIEALIDDQYV